MKKAFKKALFVIGIGLILATMVWGITLELQNWNTPLTRWEHMQLGIKPFLCTGLPGILIMAYFNFKGDI
jgi:hypothetical protein